MTLHQVVSQIVNDPVVNPVGHVTAASAVILSWGWVNPFLTGLATIMAVLWYGVTLYESKTGQSFVIRFRAHLARTLKNRGHKKVGQKIADAALEDAQKIVEVAKVEVADAKDTVADVKTAVDKA